MINIATDYDEEFADQAEGILRFPLPECEREMINAMHAQEYSDTLKEIYEMMSDELTYGDNFDSADDVCRWVIQEIRELKHTGF